MLKRFFLNFKMVIFITITVAFISSVEVLASKGGRGKSASPKEKFQLGRPGVKVTTTEKTGLELPKEQKIEQRTIFSERWVVPNRQVLQSTGEKKHQEKAIRTILTVKTFQNFFRLARENKLPQGMLEQFLKTSENRENPELYKLALQIELSEIFDKSKQSTVSEFLEESAKQILLLQKLVNDHKLKDSQILSYLLDLVVQIKTSSPLQVNETSVPVPPSLQEIIFIAQRLLFSKTTWFLPDFSSKNYSSSPYFQIFKDFLAAYARILNHQYSKGTNKYTEEQIRENWSSQQPMMAVVHLFLSQIMGSLVRDAQILQKEKSFVATLLGLKEQQQKEYFTGLHLAVAFSEIVPFFQPIFRSIGNKRKFFSYLKSQDQTLKENTLIFYNYLSSLRKIKQQVYDSLKKYGKEKTLEQFKNWQVVYNEKTGLLSWKRE